VPLRFPRGLPNIEPMDEVRPADLSRASVVELVEMRFGFPPPAPKRRR
jgi:hypothetical protein